MRQTSLQSSPAGSTRYSFCCILLSIIPHNGCFMLDQESNLVGYGTKCCAFYPCKWNPACGIPPPAADRVSDLFPRRPVRSARRAFLDQGSGRVRDKMLRILPVIAVFANVSSKLGLWLITRVKRSRASCPTPLKYTC